MQTRTASSEQVEAARRALLEGTLPDSQLVRAYPGTFRFQLYTALALAPDRAAVEKFLPLARQLDGIGGRAPAGGVGERTAARRNARTGRARPAPPGLHRCLARGELRATLLAEADAAGQEDQALYVLSREFPPRDGRLARLVDRLHDPFWDLRLLSSRVRVERRRGADATAERIARSIPETSCAGTQRSPASATTFRTSWPRPTPTRVARRTHGECSRLRRAEAAKAPIRSGTAVCSCTRGATNADADRVALARAQFEEADRLNSADCETREYSLFSLAQAYLAGAMRRSTRTMLGSCPDLRAWQRGLRAEVQADSAVLGGTA